MTADLILYNGRFSTLDRTNGNPEAVAIADGRFLAVGRARDVEARAGAATQRIDLRGRRVIPGLIDSHMHIIRCDGMACARYRQRLRC
jgi:predicted amidohydrolase YtcJ